MNPRFYFSTCQVGAEKAMKGEVLAEFPKLNFAFSRPGFITFKDNDDQNPEILKTHGVFSRLWGTVIGWTKDKANFQALIDQIPAGSILHLFERDTAVPGDELDSFVPNARIDALQKEIKGSFRINQAPKVGEVVYDLIWVDDFHVFLGRHTHHEGLDTARGNIPALKLPHTSPSRAYLKVVEAVHRFQPEIKPGMRVLEVGCSPGGATTAMLSWGMRVTGIDPKKMDERLYRDQNFNFIQKLAIQTIPTDLKNFNPDWIVMDMNIAPLEALDELAHVVSILRKNFGKTLLLSKGLLTIKLNDWKFAESIPLYLRRLEQIGFRDLHATQLCTNRQEFFVMAKRFE